MLQDEHGDHAVDIDQVFGIESIDLENSIVQIHRFDELENSSEEVLRIEGNGFGNDDQTLEFGSRDDLEDTGQVLELVSSDCDQMLEIDNNDHQIGGVGDTTMLDDQNGGTREMGCPPPAVGLEFESYDDAYNYYNSYAKDLGFAIRVKSSWTKRNSKEKRGAVLCCNCEGFKTLKDASSRRKETRTGCLAMIRLRLVESNRWRVDEVKLEHNHLFDPERAQNSKSHKKADSGSKRKLDQSIGVEVQTIKLYRAPAVDTVSSNERETSTHVNQSKRLNLGSADSQVINSYFCRVQLTNPNFFYVMDFSEEGYLRNMFWIESRSRAAYRYFGDVVAVDRTCLSNKYEIPLLAFVGVNHHGQSVLLGCGLLGDETFETYIWLLRAWLTCMAGRPPQTIITDQCKTLQSAIVEVFPRAHHRLSLPVVVQSILENLGELGQSLAFQTVLYKTVYSTMKVDEFEIAWDDMIKRFGIRDLEFLNSLYEDRERWAPVYCRDAFSAGMSATNQGESFSFFFNGYVHKQTSLKEFLDMYDLVLQKSFQNETFDDLESKQFTPSVKTKYNFELQLSGVYTKEIFLKFQEEVEMISNCVSITQSHANGQVITYMVKERDTEGHMRDTKNFEVMYDKIGQEVRCICSCFNFKGFLCRHALCVLSHNGLEEIPGQYILPRWRKDIKRLYIPDLGSNNIDISNPVQWFDHLYRRAIQVVEEGMQSQDHYMVAWQAFKESLNKVRLVGDKHT